LNKPSAKKTVYSFYHLRHK